METRSRDATPPPTSSDAPPPAPPPPGAETLTDAPRRRGGAGSGVKRKASSNLSSSSTPSKRLIKERNALNIPSLHNGPLTRARQSPSKLAGAHRAAEVEAPATSAAGGGGAAVGTAAMVPIGVEEEEEEEVVPLDEPIADAEFDLVRSRGREVHVAPTPAGWFSWNEIHSVEKHTLLSFFNGKSESRTPEIYMEIRNSIVRKFHANPQTQLELKDLEEISVGDSEAKQEVMEFLDHWGLINFHPFLPENPNLSNPGAGEENGASLLDKLYQFEIVQSCPRFVPKKVDALTPDAMPRFLPESSVAEELVGPVEPSVEYHCNSCSADCSRKRYHCQKQADFDLCSECYNNEKFGSSMKPSDFILMEPAEVPGVSGGSWTDQETLLLLEALELFSENWNEIAEHVATKSKAQCILHFLQMPIEDPFLEGGDDADDNVQEQIDPGSAQKETTASEVPEAMEIENAEGKDQPVSSPISVSKIKDDNQPVSSPINVSKIKDDSELGVACENGSSIAIDALKATFQAVGYLPEEGLPSFAEAGNPVMALAAFLTQLVEPDVASTSLRSSLKAMSEDSPSIQLATRHCFLLEDPPNEKKDPPALESAVTDTSNGDAAKEGNQEQISNGNDDPKDCTDKNKENAVPIQNEKSLSEENDTNPSVENEKMGMGTDKNLPRENEKKGVENDKSLSVEKEKTNVENEIKNQSKETEKDLSTEKDNSASVENGKGVPSEIEKNSSVPSQDCLEKPSATKETTESILPSEAAASGAKDLDNPIFPGEQMDPSAVKDGSNSTNPKDSGSPMLPGEQTGPSAVKDGSDSSLPMVISSTDPKDSRKPGLPVEVVTSFGNKVIELKSTGEKPDPVKDSGNLASFDVAEQILNTSMVEDSQPPSEEQESKQKAGIDSTIESTETPDGNGIKVLPTNNGKGNNSPSTNDDHSNHSINKLKRAAVTVLSAAAVKAKLLANQEEDQIHRLVSLIIEKQLYKLEAKLSLFTDVESVIMRMREQTERARHRLMLERQQIIAARLGAARGNPPPPTNKFAPGYGPTGTKQASLASQKATAMRRP